MRAFIRLDVHWRNRLNLNSLTLDLRRTWRALRPKPRKVRQNVSELKKARPFTDRTFDNIPGQKIYRSTSRHSTVFIFFGSH
jgi:hypothetical protein